jgi:hypothetical protein
VPLAWRRTPPTGLVVETVTLDEVAQARERARRDVEPDRAASALEKPNAAAPVPVEQRFG